MSRLLPSRYAAGSGSLSNTLRDALVRCGQPTLQGVSRFLSTTSTATEYEQASRQQDEEWEQVERIKQNSGEGAKQLIKPIISRTPRHSLSGARSNLHPGNAFHPNATDTSTSACTPSTILQTRGPHANNGLGRVECGPQSQPRSTSKDEDTFRPPWRTTSMPPLGTLPRTNSSGTSDGQNKDSRKDVVAKRTAAGTGSVAIDHLPIHPELLKTVLEKPELYSATAVEKDVFHYASTGRDVFIRQHADSSPAYLLPIIQKMISSQERRPGSTFVQTVSFAKHIAKIRPLSVLILSPWSQDKVRSFYAAKKLLSKLPKHRVRAVFSQTNMSAAQYSILEGCDVLVAKPGMLIRLMDEGDQRVEIRRKLEGVKVVVVEDADVFVRLRCMPELHYIIKELSLNTNGDRRSRFQGIIVSATPLDGPIKELADDLLSPGHICVEEPRKMRTKHPRSQHKGTKLGDGRGS